MEFRVDLSKVHGMSVLRTNEKGFGKLDDKVKTSPTYEHQMTQEKIDRLKHSVERNPFDIWFFKDRFRSQAVKILFSRLWNNGIVFRGKTAKSLKNAILRSLNGENINIVIMGGSISAGGGLNYDREDLRGVYYRVFADWWQKAVEPFTDSSAKIHNLAIGGTCSNFFTFCYRALLGPGTDIDLALFDFTVNDYMQFAGSKFHTALPLEQLIREVLWEKSSPSILFVNFVQGQAKIPVCNNLENHGQTMLAQNYGITLITLRNYLCSSPSRGRKYPRLYTSDGNHPSILAHAQIGLMIIHYVRKIILEVIASLTISKKRTFSNILLPSNRKNVVLNRNSPSFSDLPKPVFTKNLMEFLDNPRCFTRIVPDATQTSLLHQTLQVKVIGKFGFQVLHETFINRPGHQVTPVKTLNYGLQKFRSDAYSGWMANSMDSILELEIFLPLVKLSSMDKLYAMNGENKRSLAIAIRTHSNGATASVWVDEFEENGVLIKTSSTFGHTRLHTIVQHVTQGRHVLSVRTETPEVFILVGVMVGPVYK